MKFRLIRYDYLQSGIFSVLMTENFKCETLEHAYSDGSNFIPKIPIGNYTCQRYLSPKFGYEVFRLINVPEHDFIEIHKGNTNVDSDGCILLGEARDGGTILYSKFAFDSFMNFLSSIDEFTLSVENVE
jgi:Family of unknown function (DUF5675)